MCRTSLEISRTSNQGPPRDNSGGKVRNLGNRRHTETKQQLKEEPIPGSEITCRSRNYNKKEPKNRGKDATNARERAREETMTTRSKPAGSRGQTFVQSETKQTSQGAGSDSRHRHRELPEDTACSGARFKIARAFSW